ncbi:hypothetical protein K5M36_02860 [Chromobacterium vaccinii]|nr:hypothetical protein [Chromobacterium vaccinii]
MNIQPTVRLYAPEAWGELERFAKFYPGSFNLRDTTKRAVSGAINHFNKAATFKGLAERLKPNLLIDQKELQEHGFTPARNSQELSAVVEEIFTELYSCVDCTRKIIYELHKSCRGLPDSTRKMFQKVTSDQVGEAFPNPLRSAIKSADWFLGLMSIRDELTHFSIGNCSLDQGTGLISYMHQGIKVRGEILIIPDVFAEVNRFFDGINAFLGQVFHYLNSLLKREPMLQMCGIFYGRAYTRHVSAFDAKDFHGGKCDSHAWFDTQEGYRCPFADSCGAYVSAKG